MVSRRSFLALGSAALLTAPSWAGLTKQPQGQLLHASAYSTDKYNHFFGLFNESGDIIWQTKLEDRAHAPVVHPNQSIVGIVARRPGFFMNFYDVSTMEMIAHFTPETSHHFYGHALFTQDGQHIITQENHYPSGEGRIMVRAWPSGKVMQSFRSNGIGPHESVLMNDQVLVIANGGLKTHPDEDRTILNLDTMQPNVTYLSLLDGHVLHQATNPDQWHQLSIRHLDINAQGMVALGFQFQGEMWNQVPLVALSRIDQNELTYLPIPEEVRIRFKQYCGSVCFDKSGEILAVSAPKGGLVAYWHVGSQTFLGVENCRDVCGLVASNNAHEFLLSSGTGILLSSNPVQNTRSLIKKHTNLHWDNHLRQIKA